MDNHGLVYKVDKILLGKKNPLRNQGSCIRLVCKYVMTLIYFSKMTEVEGCSQMNCSDACFFFFFLTEALNSCAEQGEECADINKLQ